ncbi:MAG: hypothetical protein IVW56_09410 [Candidatus Binataceae bacterium]|nr:hypothetical protein [Candidatus Binataceae bacterium]
MKRVLIIVAMLLAIGLPRLAHAQNEDDANYGAAPDYNDVENGQLLQVASYILAPFGYALEWTVTRPLYHLATRTPLAPVLSGDVDIKYFDENSNADRLPPGTFAPFEMPANPNSMESDATPPAVYDRNVLPPVPSSVYSGAPRTYSRSPSGYSSAPGTYSAPPGSHRAASTAGNGQPTIH